MLKVVTNSMRCCFLDCQYGFFLGYVRMLSPNKTPSYFRWGSLVHRGAEAIEKGEDLSEVLAQVRKEAEVSSLPPGELQELEEMCLVLPSTLDGHLLRWHKMDEHYEPLDIETLFSLPLPSGWTFEGKTDKFIRDTRNGRLLLCERKTAAKVDEIYWARKELDSQPKGYLLGAQRALGIQTRRVFYDIYMKPQIKQKKVETREMFIDRLAKCYLLNHKTLFERRTIPYTQAEIDAYFWDINEVTETIEWHLQEGIWVKHCPANRIGSCAFLPICTRGDESKFCRRDILNPELRRDDVTASSD